MYSIKVIIANLREILSHTENACIIAFNKNSKSKHSVKFLY